MPYLNTKILLYLFFIIGAMFIYGCPNKNNNIKSITYAHMEVPCCFGMVPVIKEAIAGSGKKIPFKTVVIGIKGDKLK